MKKELFNKNTLWRMRLLKNEAINVMQHKKNKADTTQIKS